MILDPGDILVFHSDGLSEAPDPQGRQFGVPRLAELDRGSRRTGRGRAGRPLDERSAEVHSGCAAAGRSHARGDESPVTAHAAQAKQQRRRSRALGVADPALTRRNSPGAPGGSIARESTLERVADRVRTPAYVYSARSIAGRLSGGWTAPWAPAAHHLLLAEGQFQSFDSAAAGAPGQRIRHRFRRGIVSAFSARAFPRAASSFPAWASRARRFARRLRAGIRLFNVESEAELDVLAGEAARLRTPRPSRHSRQSRRHGRRPSAYFHRPPPAQVRHGLDRRLAALSAASQLALD